MRFGKNPLKNTGQEIDPPASVTVGVLNFIPEQVGFFQGQLDSLKLCLASLRAHADQPFDLLVVDNGSCAEVREFLANELDAGRIDYLILNRRNIGKANALFQIIGSSPGDFIFFSDGDYYFYSGWMQAHLDVLKAFPKTGIVSGDPRRFQVHNSTASTKRWAENNQANGLMLERGDLIPEEWTYKSLHSYGHEKNMINQIKDDDWRITLNGTQAYIGASHGQFLIPRQVITDIPHRCFKNALSSDDDNYFDKNIEDSGYLRLSVDRPYVYHIGNEIEEGWLKEEYERLVDNSGKSFETKPGKKRGYSHWFWRRWHVQKILRLIYEWAFKVYYENKK